MGNTNAVYIWAVVAGVVGFVIGGFIGGSFEKFEHETEDDRKKRLKRLGF